MAVAIPFFASVQTLDLPAILAGGPASHRADVLQPIAWVFVAALFLGSFSVTREYYYSTLGRTLTFASRTRTFIAKAAATAAASAGLAVAISALGWVTWALIAPGEEAVRQIPAVMINLGGTMLAASIAAVIGVSVGWVVRNYYAAAGLVLAIPLAVELPLVNARHEVSPFLPSGALVRLAQPAGADPMGWLVELVVVIAWAGIMVSLALMSIRRGR